MKKTSYIILIFLTSIFLSAWSVTAAEDSCSGRDEFETYNCRVENICKNYQSEKPTYNLENYEVATSARAKFQNNQSNAPALDAAKELYRENIGNIYKCAIIQSQRNSLSFLLKQLGQEDSGKLSDSIGGQIELRLSRLEISSNSIGCSLTDTQSIQNKLNILRETTYEACRYVSYLEYLKTHYKKIDRFSNEQEMQNAYGENTKLQESYTPGELSAVMNSIDSDIAEEISHTYKVLPLAFHAYSEYENNFPIHFLLEIIRADFMVLRTKLYQTLMPIAQLWLKVINAMSY